MDIVKLIESVVAFDKYLSKSDIDKAMKIYPDIKNRNTQLKLLKDAKKRKLDAVNLLFYLYKGLISKAFWKFYLGPDKKYYAHRIKNREDYDFASKAYELLASGASGTTSPWKTFNPDKFSDKTDLIKKFGYYFYRYLQSEAFKMIRQNKLKGLSGNVSSSEEVSVASYEDTYEGDEQTSVASETENIDLAVTLDSFEESLPEKYKKVFRLKRQGMSFADIAKKVGVSIISIRNYMADIKELWDDYVN